MKLQSSYNQAPELLTDQIAVLTNMIDDIKSKRGENEYSKNLERTRDVIIFAVKYFKDLEFIYDNAQNVSTMNQWLVKYSSDLEKRLLPFETIESQILSGKLGDTIELVRSTLDRKINELKK